MDTHQLWAEEALDRVRAKIAWVSEKNRDKIPYTTGADGCYDDRGDMSRNWNSDDGLSWWTNGFWSGILWMLYQDTGEERYARTARWAGRQLEKTFETFQGLHHDVGFMFLPTAVMDYRLTGNEHARTTALHAASLLAGRFNPAGRFIRAWNENGTNDVRGWVIIDCLMNLSLLYWTSEETGDPRFRHIAEAHAHTALGAFLRPDGSACHIVEFDPETGKRLRSHGGQGYGHGSAWTRGQGWAVYGFANSYAHTGKAEYLEGARRTADFCLRNLRGDGIVPIDFRQPAAETWEDSCGACVLAGGLLEAARHLPEQEQTPYVEGAVRILKAIVETRADWGRGCDAIVQNCSTACHEGGKHITMVYADYFLIEALYKLAGKGIFIW